MVIPNLSIFNGDNSFTLSLQDITKKEVAASNTLAAFFEKHQFTTIFTTTNLFHYFANLYFTIFHIDPCHIVANR